MRVDSRPSPKRASTVLAGNKRAMSGRSCLAKISFRGWPSPGTLSAGKSYKLLLGIARQFAPGQLAFRKSQYRFCKLEARFV